MKKLGIIVVAAAILVSVGAFLGSSLKSQAAEDETYPAQVAGMVIESIEVSSDCAAPDVM